MNHFCEIFRRSLFSQFAPRLLSTFLPLSSFCLENLVRSFFQIAFKIPKTFMRSSIGALRVSIFDKVIYETLLEHTQCELNTYMKFYHIFHR